MTQPLTAEDDPYWDYDEDECWNCNGEGYVYGCSWDWQCDTYDEGEGTCLCTRRCDWCRPLKPSSDQPQPNSVSSLERRG